MGPVTRIAAEVLAVPQWVTSDSSWAAQWFGSLSGSRYCRYAQAPGGRPGPGRSPIRARNPRGVAVDGRGGRACRHCPAGLPLAPRRAARRRRRGRRRLRRRLRRRRRLHPRHALPPAVLVSGTVLVLTSPSPRAASSPGDSLGRDSDRPLRPTGFKFAGLRLNSHIRVRVPGSGPAVLPYPSRRIRVSRSGPGGGQKGVPNPFS